jgi:hypothetical protein
MPFNHQEDKRLRPAISWDHVNPLAWCGESFLNRNPMKWIQLQQVLVPADDRGGVAFDCYFQKLVVVRVTTRRDRFFRLNNDGLIGQGFQKLLPRLPGHIPVELLAAQDLDGFVERVRGDEEDASRAGTSKGARSGVDPSTKTALTSVLVSTTKRGLFVIEELLELLFG